MTSIPMSIAGLHEQYLHFCEEEKHRRHEANEARRCATAAARDRKKAYQRWQRALAEREKGLR